MEQLPRPRLPMAQRRCTCLWQDGYRSGRQVTDPQCPSAALHVDDGARLEEAVEAVINASRC